MNAFFRLIGLDTLDLKRRGMWMVGGGIIAAIFAALTLEFLGIGLFLVLQDHMSQLSASLVVAAIAAILAGVTLFVTRREMKSAQDEIGSAMRTSAVAAATPTMVRLAARHAGVAGVVAVMVATFAYMEGRRK